LTTTIPISGLDHTACALVFSSSRRPLPGLPVEFTTGLLARLWPDGTCTDSRRIWEHRCPKGRP